MPPKSTSTRSVVKRLRWVPTYDGKYTRQPGEVVVASFATHDEAVLEARAREMELRKHVNPFDCGNALHYLTSLDEPRLRDWLLDHGIDPPEPGKKGVTAWSVWWKKNHKKLKPDQRAAVWEALDRVRFFTVAVEDLRPVGYAVVQVSWNYNDEYYEADPEGGRVTKVYRSRRRAEEECARLNAEEREKWGDPEEEFGLDPEDLDESEEWGMFDMQPRVEYRNAMLGSSPAPRQRAMFPSATGVPFFEVIEVELEGLE